MELEEKFEKMTEGPFYKHLADRVKDSDVTSKPKFKKKDEVLRRKTTTTIQDELEEFWRPVWGTSSVKAQQEDMEAALRQHAVFPRIIAGGDHFFFSHKKRKAREGDYFKYYLLEVVPYIFCFIFPLNKKIITLNKLNMGFQNQI